MDALESLSRCIIGIEKAGKRNPNNEHYQFWQQHNQPIELQTDEMTKQKLDYLHHNPVVTGLVENDWEYLYSSARDYQAETRGLLEIMHLF